MFIGAIGAIERSVFEAASLDGVNRWQQYKYIIWPNIKKIFYINLLLSAVSSLSEFDLPFAIASGGANGTATYMTLICRIAFTERKIGLASTGNANGLVYNKKVFRDAGITELPKTPLEFIEALKRIKERTNAIPLYTNYADEWPMSSWDAYMGINATGEAEYINQRIIHEKDPFSNKGDSTHPYSVYKILYDAVSMGLTEPDYTTTSESLCYGMINNGDIGCLAFGSWAVAQAQAAGNNPGDIGFMPFPITVNEKQYVSINGDYSYGINKKSSANNKIASMLYVKWLIHESGFDYSEGGLSVLKGGKNPDFYDILDGCEVLEDASAKHGEENYFDLLNRETGLLFNAKGQSIVEHAFKGDKSFDGIMREWNQLWAKAQDKHNIIVN